MRRAAAIVVLLAACEERAAAPAAPPPPRDGRVDRVLGVGGTWALEQDVQGTCAAAAVPARWEVTAAPFAGYQQLDLAAARGAFRDQHLVIRFDAADADFVFVDGDVEATYDLVLRADGTITGTAAARAPGCSTTFDVRGTFSPRWESI